VTITGLPGQAMPLWNLRFQRASVELCPSCAFTMDSIAIANERRGNGAAVDIFVGAKGDQQAQQLQQLQQLQHLQQKQHLQLL
jgi:hypothetical protein